MTGTQPYHQSLHSGNRCPLSLHNHVGYFPLIGMGEFGAILNGVQFYTRFVLLFSFDALIYLFYYYR